VGFIAFLVVGGLLVVHKLKMEDIVVATMFGGFSVDLGHIHLSFKSSLILMAFDPTKVEESIADT
jgi:hypothetical protein